MSRNEIFTTFESFFNYYDNLPFNVNIDEINIINKLKPSSDELQDHIFAVHASNYLWPDAVLRPYRRVSGQMDISEGINTTIHFALGSLVAPHHDVFSWEDSPFAIVTPLRNLMSQLMSIYTYDSFINGSWQVLPNTILIAPIRSVNDDIADTYLTLGCDIFYYDPDKITIRQVISNIIKDNGGVNIELLHRQVIVGTSAYLESNRHLNVNTPEFFQSLFISYPNLSFGNDIQSVFGNGYCYGNIRQLSNYILESNNSNKTAMLTAYLDYVYSKIQHNIDDLKVKDEIESLIRRNYHLLDSIETGYYINHPTDILANMTLDEVQKFVSIYPMLFQSQSGHNSGYILIMCWAVKRYLLVGQDRGKRENLDNIYRDNLTKLFSSYDSIKKNTVYLLLTNAYEAIVGYLERDSDRSIVALEILNDHIFINYNNYLYDTITAVKNFNIEIPKVFNTYQHFDSISDALADYGFKNGELMDRYNGLRNVYPLETSILLDISPVPIETNLEKLNGSFSASTHTQHWIPTQDFIEQLDNLQMSNIDYNLAKYYLARCSKYYVNAVYLWRRLGLGIAYKRNYGDDDHSFWYSSYSFIDIYNMLHDINTR